MPGRSRGPSTRLEVTGEEARARPSAPAKRWEPRPGRLSARWYRAPGLAQLVHAVAHRQPLAHRPLVVERAARVDDDDTLGDELGGQRDVGGGGEILRLRLAGEVAVGEVQARRHPNRRDERARWDLDGFCCHEDGACADPARPCRRLRPFPASGAREATGPTPRRRVATGQGDLRAVAQPVQPRRAPRPRALPRLHRPRGATARDAPQARRLARLPRRQRGAGGRRVLGAHRVVGEAAGRR